MNDNNNQNENSSENGIIAKITAFITFLRNFISSGEESTSGNLLQNKKVQIAIGVVLLLFLFYSFGSSNDSGIKLFFGIIFWIAVAVIIYFGRKMYLLERENTEGHEALHSNEDYQKFKKILKIAIVVCVVSQLSYSFSGTSADNSKFEEPSASDVLSYAYYVNGNYMGHKHHNEESDILYKAFYISEIVDTSKMSKKTFLTTYEKNEIEKDVSKHFIDCLNKRLKSFDGFEDFDVQRDIEIIRPFESAHVNGGAFFDVTIKLNGKNNPFNKKGFIKLKCGADMNPDHTWRIRYALPTIYVND